MRSPRFIDRESSVASEPLATVSTTAATDSPIPTQTRPLSRSPSSALAASATKIGDEVLMMPALSVVTQHDAGEAVAPAGRRGERRARGRDRQQQQRREDGAGGPLHERGELIEGQLAERVVARGSQMGRPCRTGEGQQGRTPPSGAYFFFFLAAFFFFTDSPPSRRMLSAC